MKITLFAFLIMATVSSCKQNNDVNPESESKENTEIPSSDTQIVNTEHQIIERDDLVSGWAKELEKISRNDKFRMGKELVENRHMKDVIDTIKTFSFRKTSLRVYHTKGLYAVESAKINDPEFSLKGPVQIGMGKNKLGEILNLELNKNIVKVNNELGTLEFNFYFKNNILQRINFQGYVD